VGLLKNFRYCRPALGSVKRGRTTPSHITMS